MAKTFLPLAKSPLADPKLWSKVARNWLATGVIKSYLNELQVYADSTGMQVKVKSGASNVQAIYFDSDAEEVLPISNADATNPRIDRVIIRLDLTADNIDFAILQGVPAVSPIAPALTQNNTRWEISLAQVYVGANVSTITAGNITDERVFTQNAGLANSGLTWTNVTFVNTYTDWGNGSTANYPLSSYSKDKVNIVRFRGMPKTGTYGLNNAMFNVPDGFRPSSRLNFICAAFHGSYGWGLCTVEVQPGGNLMQVGSLFNGYPAVAPTWIDLCTIQYPIS